MPLVLRAYSLGAGTYTGIEAVSNGLTPARTARADRQTHDGLHGHVAGVCRWRTAAGLSALPRPACGRQDAQRRAVRANHRRVAGAGCRSGFVVAALASSGRAAVHRRADRLPRRPARAGEHGAGPLDADAVRHVERPAGHAERRAADGLAALLVVLFTARLGGHARRALQHQRLHHLHPFSARHGAPLVDRARQGAEMENQDCHQRLRPAAHQRHSGLALRRQIL